MHRVSFRVVGCPRLWTRKPPVIKTHRGMSTVNEGSGLGDPPAILRRESPDDQEPGPRKKSRKSAIMEALRRGASQTDGTPSSSRHMSTGALVSNSRSTSPRHQTRPKSPILVSGISISSTGLPFYRHTEPLESSSLPALLTSQVEYLRDMDQANYAVSQMIDRMDPFPGSRWRGVVGFDMEWTVGFGMAARKTGLIQDLITSATILKVGVNIEADMKKLCRDFGSSYAARGVLELSHLARAVDVGLVGTKVDDLETNRASLGVGIPRNIDCAQISNGPDPIVEEELPDLETNRASLGVGIPRNIDCAQISNGPDPIVEEELPDEENVQTPGENEPVTPAKKEGTNNLVRSGRRLISLARLVRRYLERELEKGDVRTSNWEKVLTDEQKQYAANDAHAGLALYLALRKIHSRSVAEGVIPVPSPPPWEDHAPANSITGERPSEPRPAPPPFGARVTTRQVTPGRKFVPTSELQDLTPIQLELILPWDSVIKDLQAEFDEARAAVLVKRKKEGVDLKGRGEVVVAASAAAEAVEPAQPVDTPSSAHTSNSKPGAVAKPLISNPLGNSYYDNPQPGNSRSFGKGRSQENYRRPAYQEQNSDALGKKWPPTRAFVSRPTETLSRASSSTTPTVSRSVSETEPPLDIDGVDSEPEGPTRPSIPTSNVGSPTPGSNTRPTSQHLRAYLLWYKQQLPLPQICASLRSARYPLAKSTVISYIIQALQADEKLPFEETRLKDLVSLDTTNWIRENYRQFLESKVGPMENESQ
ncbi:unnamed protein product [Rhizoctonia solani]|uniref:3'-5' exonuclease domain-containing protein n=1 Tax=Rhizoctonia solani TaxID=456999 RepID=A0A8H3HBC1_9AGAM|nr:unnamed protein product [Rhizoctonia solani]